MKVVTILLRYDYGILSRGDSLEYKGFYNALKQITNNIYAFWYDKYLDKEEELQRDVISFVEDTKPDIIFFILYKNEFKFSTLDYFKSKYITINWFCDDQWRFDIFTRYYAPHFTYSITTDKFSLDKYYKIGYKNAIFSQWASLGYNGKIDFNNIEYKYDISFVGGISGYRKWIIKELLKVGIRVRCFGHGWSNGRVSFEDMSLIFKISKINLNISNSTSYDVRYIFSSFKSLREFIKAKKRAEQIKARNFEIPAFGGFQLTNYVVGLEDYYGIGDEIATYTDIEDLILQIRYYLKNELERRKIMINGYKRTKKEHAYYHRLKAVFNRIIEEMQI